MRSNDNPEQNEKQEQPMQPVSVDILSLLPAEILCAMLLYVPPHKTPKLHRVSTLWRNTMDDPVCSTHIWKFHYRRHFPDAFEKLQLEDKVANIGMKEFRDREIIEYSFPEPYSSKRRQSFSLIQKKLFIACKDGDNQAIKALIPSLNLEDLLLKDVSQRVAAYYACRNGHQSTCELIYREFVLQCEEVQQSGMIKLKYGIMTYQNRESLIAICGERGVQVNEPFHHHRDYTPLTLAVSLGHLETVDALLIAGANVNVRDRCHSPLENSLRYGHLHITERLLLSEPNIAEDRRVMIDAAASGNCELVRRLHGLGGNIDCLSEYNAPPIYYSIDTRDYAMVKQLIELGANLDEISFVSYRLQNYNHLEIAKLVLVEKLARFIAITDALVSPELRTTSNLLMSAMEGRESVISLSAHKLIIDGNPVLSNIRLEATKMRIIPQLSMHELESVSEKFSNLCDEHKKLIEKMFSEENMLELFSEEVLINDCLRYAIECGYVSLAQAMIDFGADLTLRDSEGNALIKLACERGKIEIMALLLRLGADINSSVSEPNWGMANVQYPCLLFYAIASEREASARFLIKNGAAINFQDRQGFTPLHYACVYRGENLVPLLIDKGASLTAVTAKGYTPLHSASYNGNCKAAQLLVENGASLECKNVSGETPLQLAISMRDDEMVKLLRAAAQKKSAESSHGSPRLN